ncbi:MAG: ATP-binding protein [Muribaculaceae bacterium]|nr:ATP-binding protein [Muribaculaceae bacterium]
MEIIRRQMYLDHIISVMNKGMMLVLVGQRRVGKSYILLDLKKWIKENEPTANIVYLDKEHKVGDEIMDAGALYRMAIENLPIGGRNYLLVDEVQNIENYQDALRSLYTEERCQIIVTGSNAYIYSSELGTRLGGRYIEIPIYSLSYTEFLEFHKLPDTEDSLQLYLKVGGLPGLRHFDLGDNRQVSDYIQGVYTTIMMRDVVERANIRNATFLTNLAKFVADTTGKPVSPTNIANTMRGQGDKITKAITSDYLEYMSNALVFKPILRYDIHGKRLFEQTFKYYFTDHGIRNFLCGFKVRQSIEKVMETVVLNHLLMQGFEVTVGALRNGEVDFVAERDEKRIYFQVTYLLASQETIDREFGNLNAIQDQYPKYVVSMDPIGGEVDGYPGILHIRLRDFLKMSF